MDIQRCRDGTQSVGRALDILECFTVQQPTLSLTEISGRLKLTVPTAHRLLRALQEREMVLLDPLSHKYSLGPGAARLAAVMAQRNDLQSIAVPYLNKLRDLTGETVGLHRMSGYRRVCIMEVVSPQPIRVISGVGTAYPLYAGAAGKALLAWLPTEQVKSIIEESGMKAVTPRTPRDREILLAELAEVRQQGFAITFGETIVGAAALAAPVLNALGEPVASVNITGPADRWDLDVITKTIKALLDVTSLVSQQLGHPGSGARAARGKRWAGVRDQRPKGQDETLQTSAL